LRDLVSIIISTISDFGWTFDETIMIMDLAEDVTETAEATGLGQKCPASSVIV